ncbi:MAG TPA: hypothetical protein VGH87_21060 [Polyangiaceae bacterium]|jgi:hypothetical protein|nr:hypothetical protein [Polyangiaceae bacterium]
MRRRILIALLALGTVGGYAAGFAHMHHSSCHNWNANGDWHGRSYNNSAAHYDCADQRDSR